MRGGTPGCEAQRNRGRSTPLAFQGCCSLHTKTQRVVLSGAPFNVLQSICWFPFFHFFLTNFPHKIHLFHSASLHLFHRRLKITSVTLTRILQLPPCLRYQREAPGQRPDQTPERGVGHHDHLLPVMLLEEGLQD